MTSYQRSGRLPDFDWAINAYDTDAALRRYVHHNHRYWRVIHGGLALVRKSPLSFDPIPEYWHQTERRLLAAFFSHRLRASYCPADALRRMAFQTFRHFNLARQDGVFGEPALATVQSGMWPAFCETAIEVATQLPASAEYDELRKVWGRRLKRATLAEELVAFLEDASEAETLGALEKAFFLRLPWFPYMGLDSLTKLVERQRFFCGYYRLLASTNSYLLGGSMNFAPVIQNNSTGEVMAYVERWASGETPHETKFSVLGKDERRDRSHHAPVVELFGFLNLHHYPFHNSVPKQVYEAFAHDDDPSVFDRLKRIGAETAGYLADSPQAVDALASKFRKLADEPTEEPTLLVEGIRLDSVAKRYPAEVAKQVEVQLAQEMNEAAAKTARGFTQLEAATAMLHLLVDAAIYREKDLGGSEPPPSGNDTLPPSDDVIRLPPSLRTDADDALGYMYAGFHVLFAGPPGTGKTTLGQLVGYAWNNDLELVPDEISLSDAPKTTVGNSAWAPFHTIGGVMPSEKGAFRTVKGIFIDPEHGTKKEWVLLDEALVLDEMNRADLDRCVGELYPLLSNTVERVYPAGIPGVHCIRSNSNFRILATVNDATLDDIVFPISEGLARRFIRIELLGATQDSLETYLGDSAAQAERREAALHIIAELFEICSDEGKIDESELGDHLPFGVGYFATLKTWVEEELHLSTAFSERDTLDQARLIVLTCLRSAVRVRGMESLLHKLRAAEEEV